MKEGWEYKKIDDISTIVGRIGFRGYTKNDLVSKPELGAITLSPSNIINGELSFEKCSYISLKKYEESPEIMLAEGDVVLVKTASIGKCSIVRSLPHKATLNPQFVVFKNIKIDNEYFNYYIKSPYFQKSLKTIVGGVAIPTLSQKKLGQLEIYFPTSYDEQRRIVSYLDSSFKLIDEIKNKALKSLTEAKALFQSALAEAMEPKEGWEEKALGEIATEMYRGSGIKRDQITPIGFPCLRYGEIYTTYNYSFSECISHTNESIISPKKYFEKGDILFAITGESVEDIGKCIAYTGKEKCLLGGDIVAMKHNQYPQFLAYALSTKEAIRQKGLGKVKLKVVHTNIPALKTIRIYLPNISTQMQIVSHLDKLSSKVRAIEEKYQKMVEECDALKQAMLRDVFE